MNKVLVTVNDNCIYFSKYNREISSQNLNNTNIINTKNLKFTEQYINENMDLISTFFNLIIIKFNINSVVIKNLEIAETIVKLVNELDGIKNIYFKDDKSLNYTISSLLLENKKLEKIECYNLPEIMFYKFEEGVVKTRIEVLSVSSFFNCNNINTYSDVYNKRTLIISKEFNNYDIDDLRYFFETNKNLKRIEFKNYNKNSLEIVLKLVKKNNLSKICIIIYEDETTTKEILEDISLFEKFNREFDVDIKVKYSKQYKEKNVVKEVNLFILKYIIIIASVFSFLLFLGHLWIEKKNSNEIENNINEINKTIENVENSELNNNSTEEINEDDFQSENNITNSYYTNYSKVYNELLNINSDTVGWLTVNGTKINYPVVQSKDNDYYLNRAYDKSVNGAGWIFVDYRNNMDDLSKNTVIYGHSMINGGLMFSTLKNVLNSEWYNNLDNLTISFSVKGIEHKWHVFSIYSIEKTTDYLYSDFKSDDSFVEFINKVKTRSIKNFNIDVNSTDKILTLSTCYKDNKHRVVLHAKLLDN